ncbi:hypothetical protein [Noviherbaspirillum cavernae]|nr:hypothetical protein [Noviherbaspirillum cavernae]
MKPRIAMVAMAGAMTVTTVGEVSVGEDDAPRRTPHPVLPKQ